MSNLNSTECAHSITKALCNPADSVKRKAKSGTPQSLNILLSPLLSRAHRPGFSMVNSTATVSPSSESTPPLRSSANQNPPSLMKSNTTSSTSLTPKVFIALSTSVLSSSSYSKPTWSSIKPRLLKLSPQLLSILPVWTTNFMDPTDPKATKDLCIVFPLLLTVSRKSVATRKTAGSISSKEKAGSTTSSSLSDLNLLKEKKETKASTLFVKRLPGLSLQSVLDLHTNNSSTTIKTPPKAS